MSVLIRHRDRNHIAIRSQEEHSASQEPASRRGIQVILKASRLTTTFDMDYRYGLRPRLAEPHMRIKALIQQKVTTGSQTSYNETAM